MMSNMRSALENTIIIEPTRFIFLMIVCKYGEYGKLPLKSCHSLWVLDHIFSQNFVAIGSIVFDKLIVA